MPDRLRMATVVRLLAALAVAAPLALGALAAQPAQVRADGLKMTAHALLHGRTRAGAWFGIAVDVENSGPTVTGELRVQAGSDGRTRFAQAAELATASRKHFVLFAQPPAVFADKITVELVSGSTVVASATTDLAQSDAGTLTIGILADNAARLVSQIDLTPAVGSASPILAPLTAADLPERVQAWAPLDILVWQDTDASSLSKGQLDALRAWVAQGGRLVIVGGTKGADSLTGLPDDLLPYRPTGTLDIDPAILRPVLGGAPTGGSSMPALAGALAHGRALATSGDRTVAADMPFGAGNVTLLGFDPTTPALATGGTWSTPLWRRLLPARSGASPVLTDDSAIVNAAATLPSSGLPPTDGLLALLVAYIVLVGPVNYVVLRFLDRREWAWVTVPVLIAAFTAGAFGIGVVTRGSDVVVHEIAIVHGAPGTDQATAQSWLAIFSPSRSTFAVGAPGDTLLSGTMMTGMMQGQTSGGMLDVLEGDPTRIRDLSVGYGSIRTIRAEGSATGPRVDADLHLEGSTIKGTLTNRSTMTLASPALVLGASATTLDDIAPGATVNVQLQITHLNQNNFMPLSARLIGQNWGGPGAENQRLMIRQQILDQLTQNAFGGFGGPMPAGVGMAVPVGMPMSLQTGTLMLLAWGRDPVVQIDLDGQARRSADVLYEIPMRVAVKGAVRFVDDLLPGATTSSSSMNTGKDPFTTMMTTGTITTSYRPMAFDGTLTPTSVSFALSGGDLASLDIGKPVDAPMGRCDPAAKDCAPRPGFPDVDVLDVRTGTWVELGTLQINMVYGLPDPARWVDATTGEVQVRFVNRNQDTIGFQFPIAVEGTVQ